MVPLRTVRGTIRTQNSVHEITVTGEFEMHSREMMAALGAKMEELDVKPNKVGHYAQVTYWEAAR